MTAEAIVMNRSAVALAADSAVTIGNKSNMKIYESANKLFELIKGSNIGVMIYSSANINSTPWETVIKTYRHEHSTFAASHVEDYADHFLAFLAGHSGLIKPDNELKTARFLAYDFLVTRVIDRLLHWPGDLTTSSGRVIQVRMKNALDSIMDDLEAEVNGLEDVDASTGYGGAIDATFKSAIETILDSELSDNGIVVTRAQLKRLARIVLTTFVKKYPSPSNSGLVFAGFGTADYFPKRFATNVTARFCGEVIRFGDSEVEITADRSGHWETFAQDGPAKGWANGITDDMRDAIIQKWISWLHDDLPKKSNSALRKSGFGQAEARKATKVFSDLTKESLIQFSNFMSDWENSYYRLPMQASVAMLPKDELGLLAESLVNITSMRQRMSIHQQNTVGGAIDVALISIGDGFIWLNRKHYFENQLNPTWHLTHGASIKTEGHTGTGA